MKHILIAAIAAITLTGANAQGLKSELGWNVVFTGTPNANDREAAIWLIDKENAKIEQANAALAEGETPTPLYLKSNRAKLKASAQAILSKIIENAWDSFLVRAGQEAAAEDEVEKWYQEATEEARAAAKAALLAGQKPKR